jgi:hypothetical protein
VYGKIEARPIASKDQRVGECFLGRRQRALRRPGEASFLIDFEAGGRLISFRRPDFRHGHEAVEKFIFYKSLNIVL